jgi:hypothetical protein
MAGALRELIASNHVEVTGRLSKLTGDNLLPQQLIPPTAVAGTAKLFRAAAGEGVGASATFWLSARRGCDFGGRGGLSGKPICLPQRAARIKSEMSQRSNVEISSVVLLTISSSSLRAAQSNRRRGHTGSPPSMTL